MSVYERRELFIGGEWVQPVGTGTIEVVSPADERTLARVSAPAAADVDHAVAAAREAFDHGPWPRLDPLDRVAAVLRLTELYEPQEETFAQLVTSEMGAPITFARSAQAHLPGRMMRAFARLASGHSWSEVRRGAFGADVVVRKEPVGVVAAIIPWNMPVFMTVVKLIPALLAGCTVVLKPAAETPLDALLMAELIEGAGFPAGVVSVLPGDRRTGEQLVAHQGVDKVSFTGSTAAGRQVAAACGAALKRVSLELGGKSSAVVLDDADPETVASGMLVAGLMNGGQACVAQTRVLLPQRRYGEFVDALAAALDGLVVGDPTDPATRLGPMVTRRQQQRVLGYIEAGEQAGARLVTGGTKMPDGLTRGWYVRPTLFTGVDNSMSIAQDEIFGPVLTAIPHTGDEHAAELADATSYGLSGSVWTPDTERGMAVAERVRSGTFGINAAYSMDPAAPFGGVKASGIGRELGAEGLDGYLDTKSVSIAP